MHEKIMEEKLEKIPKSLRKEALDYLDFLINKYQSKKSTQKKFKFDWEGGLSDIKITSVELQHNALEWR
ncbi:MAG: DUF2281 domain-containing protein [Candidatus Stahlbacteria bacterium]|nr:DUF2281 domain-containing protein [Candidatus Stahlbacteria bacterium]